MACSSPVAQQAPDHTERYYDDRFSDGYMERWPAWKRARVRDLLREQRLPERGTALDFGCGNGVFTEVLLEALPGWEVTGCDISRRALAGAAQRVPRARFAHLHDLVASKARFDLVFSHHVLEHVRSLEESLEQIGGLLSDRGTALHILPCGNPGSFEHEICSLRRDGIGTGPDGRFFFEDPGHLRRLRSERLVALCATQGLRLRAEAYACHRAGAVDWITRSGPGFIESLTDPEQAMDVRAARRLVRLRRRLLLLAHLRSVPARFRGAWRAAVLPLYVLGRFVERHLSNAERNEWKARRADPRGSEMYLFFSRRPEGSAW